MPDNSSYPVNKMRISRSPSVNRNASFQKQMKKEQEEVPLSRTVIFDDKFKTSRSVEMEDLEEVSMVNVPRVPDLYVTSISPNASPRENRIFCKVILPSTRTRVEQKRTEKRIPDANISQDIQISSVGRNENISSFLKQIDFTKLRPGRVGKAKESYNLIQLKDFATKLGISVSGKSKGTLIEEILKIKKERDLE